MRRNNNAGTDKEEEKKLVGPLAKMELLAEGCSRTGVSNRGPRSSFVRPGKGISQKTMCYEY